MSTEIDVTLFAFADTINVTKDEKLNIAGMFTSITAPALPIVVPSMSVIFQFSSPVEWGRIEHDLKITLTPPGTDEPAVSISWHLPVHNAPPPLWPDPRLSNTLVQPIPGLVIQRDGLYVASAFVDGNEVRRTFLRVVSRGEHGGG